MFSSIPWKTFSSFIGPGYMVAVGYLDPGNWATDLAAGSEFGYSLLFVILMANLMAIALQYLCIKLGVVTQKDLAENCRAHLHPWVNILFYIMCELAIIATDLAEVIGTAIALKLLFGLPLTWGILITGLDVLIILLGFKAKYLRIFEAFIALLVVTVAVCFSILLSKVDADWAQVAKGYLPIITILGDPNALYLAIGIIGATVMPHNLYLHSNMVKYRSSRHAEYLGMIVDVENEDEKPKDTQVDTKLDQNQHNDIRKIIKYMNLDSMFALWFALLINSAILVVAAATFHKRDEKSVGDIEEAYNLLVEYVGKGSAIAFAIALFCSGQSSTITGTLAGQIVMQGFLGNSFKIPAWARRLVTRSIALVPALIVSLVVGDSGINQLLVLSQVILSLQLPFAVWPLVIFTSNKSIMSLQLHKEPSSESGLPILVENDLEGSTEYIDFSVSMTLKIIAVGIALVITGLNIYLLTAGSSAFTGH